MIEIHIMGKKDLAQKTLIIFYNSVYINKLGLSCAKLR